MRELISAMAITSISLLAACTPKNKEVPCADLTVKATEADSARLANYMTENNIEATYDPRGFYYKIRETGNESRVGFCGKAVVTYVGKFTNGQQFDSGNKVNFSLENLISGFRYGLNLIGEGGKATFYFPPSLGYGNDDYQGIPGGSILVFSTELNSITK